MAVKAVLPNSDVEVRFTAAATNQFPAELSAGFGVYHANGNVPGINIRPGVSGRKIVHAPEEGTLWVHVNLNPDGDSGRLELYINGELHEASHVTGDRWRLFKVQQPREVNQP